MPPPSIAAWIIREHTTIQHIRGLLKQLEAEGVLDYADIRIIAISEDSFADTPWGVFTYDNLPPEGLVMVSDDG